MLLDKHHRLLKTENVSLLKFNVFFSNLFYCSNILYIDLCANYSCYLFNMV